MTSNTPPSTPANYIAGDWQPPSGTERHQINNPATTEALTTVTFSSQSDIDDAVSGGLDAFETWRETPVEERIQPLFRLKQLLEEEQEALAETLVKEHGKTFDEAMGEIRRGIENVEVACGVPMTMQSGTLLNAAPEIDESAPRRPLGVFAAITPFNFPVMIPLWFLPHAVATGNSFILKPSERVPLTSTHLLSLIEEAGFPEGLINLVHGDKSAVNHLLEHPDIEGISFVGSTPIAKHIYETAAAHGKRVQAQGGAKNHIIVSKHADLDFAAEKTVGSAFANTGQRCLANPIAVVEEDVYDEFTANVVSRTRDLTVGDGLASGTDMGPVHTEAHAKRIREDIETGIQEGATLLLDGREEYPDEPATYLGPTVFGDVTPDMNLATEELFGPVLALSPISDVAAGIQRINDSRYGNAASLFTSKGSEARQFKHDAEAGNLGINAGTAAPMAFYHFGGWNESFFGDLHAQGEDMVQFYTDKVVCIERWPESDTK